MPSSPGQVITGGIQGISALLPLLGTEQCEEHAGSALTHGYFYAAATPMSIFGSLGLVLAGAKAFVASVTIRRWNFLGARILQDAGFLPSGKNLSLIMADQDSIDRKCHLAETRLDSLLEALHVEDLSKVRLPPKPGFRASQSNHGASGEKPGPNCWFPLMCLITAAFCIASITPYIYLIVGNNSLSPAARYTFPCIRAAGGFLTATSLQFLIQNRLSIILKSRLIFQTLNSSHSDLLKSLADDEKIQLEWDEKMASEICIWSLERYIWARNRRISSSDWKPWRLLAAIGITRSPSGDKTSKGKSYCVRHPL